MAMAACTEETEHARLGLGFGFLLLNRPFLLSASFVPRGEIPGAESAFGYIESTLRSVLQIISLLQRV